MAWRRRTRSFFGDPAILAQDPVTAPVALPFGAWEIAAIPAGGWRGTARHLGRARALPAGAALSIVAPILGAARLRRVAPGQARAASATARRSSRGCRGGWSSRSPPRRSGSGMSISTPTSCCGTTAPRRCSAFRRPHGLLQRGRLDRRAAPRRPRPGGRRRPTPRSPASGKFVTTTASCSPTARSATSATWPRVYHGEDGSRRLVGLVWDVTADVERQEELEPAPARGRGRDRREVAVPRRDEPRDPHPDERRARAARPDAGRSAAGEAARARAGSRWPRRRACCRSSTTSSTSPSSRRTRSACARRPSRVRRLVAR